MTPHCLQIKVWASYFGIKMYNLCNGLNNYLERIILAHASIGPRGDNKI